MSVQVAELHPPPDPEQALLRLCSLPHCVFLDSALKHAKLGRYSFIAADPFEFLRLDVKGPDALRRLDDALRRFPATTIADLPPFQGGAAGLFSYELGRQFERVPAARFDEFQLPAMAVGLYDVVVAFDHQQNRAWIVSQGFPETEERSRRNRAVERLREFQQWLGAGVREYGSAGVSELNQQTSIVVPSLPHAPTPSLSFPVPGPAGLTSNFSREAYLAAVQRAIDYIYAGDVFQVNLAQRLLFPVSGVCLGSSAASPQLDADGGWLGSSAASPQLDTGGACLGSSVASPQLDRLEKLGANLSKTRDSTPATRHVADSLALYLRLRRRNPATFAGYFDLGDFQIVSASPERFLQVRGREVEARPIKGTRRRSHQPEADLYAGSDLLASEKDRAENVMIVDLLRNDLSRVCTPDSVRVTQLCEVEIYEYVQHLVSAVRGELRQGLGALDLVRAAFPGGSITGAPKVRAMEIIAELEPTARGAYCGCLGYLSFDGSLDLSILIRTITAGRGWWQFPVGGGIVAQSEPEREYEETWHKAEGLLRALE